ncbi:rod shape-determining protein RodA [Pleionea sp. CnH1-48]|uniref:rod shape-determining protein RodA n=1 Tax=Pleionea sp. CnH1-48 TaxID=2954494 RepID=UPI002097DE3B|nr:rod shape-determining protein RodA [Pleionea sp. CnH1-48]MCO7227379.1 rod shape-determining protein RodA [Pleionea sp. CnH1-48]
MTSKVHTHKERQSLVWRLHLDLPLLAGLFALMGFGLMVLYSAGGESESLIYRQVTRLGIGLAVMFMMAQFPPRFYAKWAPFLYLIGLVLLIAVIFFGDKSKGAQRWLMLGGFRFQPSELMKLAVPLMVAWYFSERPLPARKRELFIAAVLVLVPTLLIAKQPDLGTALLISSSGLFAIYLSGVSWRIIAGFVVAAVIFMPIHWFFLIHEYQKDRVYVYLEGIMNQTELCKQPDAWQICQSQVAIGSGGFDGKGWLNGTQSQLEFLPERSTDFIFAVLGEEFGFTGVAILLSIYLFIIARGLYIGTQAQETFSRLLAGAIVLTFFVYLFVNIGMVTGLLPVVGLPLPLVSYGGTSMVTLLSGFGMLMSIYTHRKLVST